MRDDEEYKSTERWWLVWGSDNFWGSTGLFLIIIIGIVIAVFVPIAESIIAFLSIAAPILYGLIGLIYFVIPGFLDCGATFTVPAVLRIAKLGLIGYFVIYRGLAAIDLPNMDEVSGLFETLGTGLIFIVDVFIHIGFILLFVAVDCIDQHLELSLSENSIVLTYIVSIVSTILLAVVLFVL